LEFLGSPRMFAVFLLCIFASARAVRADDASSLNAANGQNANSQLKSLSLEQLGNV